MLVLLAVYAVIRTPLTYTASLPTADSFDTVQSVKQTVSYMVYREDAEREEADRQIAKFLQVKKTQNDSEFWTAQQQGAYNLYSEINAIHYIRENPEAFAEMYDASVHYNKNGEAVKVGQGIDFTGKDIAESLPDLELFAGFDLGTIPAISHLKAEKIGTKLLLLIPVLTLITSYFGQALTRKFTYQPEQTEDMKSQMRMMNIFMPLFSLYIAFQVPAAVGIYWMIQNLLSPVQQLALSKIYPIPEITPEEMREAERLYGGKQKKKKIKTDPNKKKRSLVYDDDDEYESVSTVSPKKVLTEKKKPKDGGVIEKAPLKDDNKD